MADNAKIHLERLGAVLRHRGWRATVRGGDQRPTLYVTNPAAPVLSETIVCRNAPAGWRYMWPWREEIGPADKAGEVADRITHVLRGVTQ